MIFGEYQLLIDMTRKVLDISDIFNKRGSDIAVLLGCGPSINEISDQQWDVINKNDKWAVNNWLYHPTIVPTFYHVELKAYDFDLFKRRLTEKVDLYKDVHFIIPSIRTVKLVNKETGEKYRVGLDQAIPYQCQYVYKYDFASRGKHTMDVKEKNINADYIIKSSSLTKSYDTSMTLVLEILYKMGYKRIYLYGIDLINSYYFWTGGDERYGEVHHQTNKQHEGKDPNLPHQTYKIKNFIVDFNKRHMMLKGRNIFVGHKKTMLYPEIEYKDILEG